MTGFFNDYWGKLEKVKELAHIGSSEIIGRGISAIFWFYIASQVGPEIFGQLSFILGIVSFADAFSSIGTQNSVTVYAAKKNSRCFTFIHNFHHNWFYLNNNFGNCFQ